MQENLKEQIASKKIMEKKILFGRPIPSKCTSKKRDGQERRDSYRGRRTTGTEASTMRPNIDWFLKI